MIITDEDLRLFMPYMDEHEYEELRDAVAYLTMGGYPFPTENPMREVVWVHIQMKNGKHWNWEAQLWEKQHEMV